VLSYNPINSEVLLHNGGEPYALKGASTVRRGVHAKTCKGCAVPTLQFVARKHWLWSYASPRRFRADCVKIGGIMEAYAYPYSSTSVHYKV